MPKRTLAALGVVLAFAAVLVVVPLATADDAGADTRTKTVQRCAYDPFAGRQCWTETVSVSHVHRCGAGLTGTYPNCYPIPPATQPVCPAGMTGTPPNCYPPPPATTEPSPPTTTAAPPPTTAAPPPTTQPPPPTTTIYVPPTTAPPLCTPWPACREAELEAEKRKRAEAEAEAERKRKEAEAEKKGCTKKIAAGYLAAVEHHRHMLAGHMTGCHPAVANNHCQDGEHAHTHAGACHRNNVNVPSLQRHCSPGEHQHKHGEGHCHPRDTPHCEDGEHYHYATHTRSSTDGKARCHDIGDHPWLHEECGEGQHNHRDKVFPRVKGCHDEHTQHNTGDLSKTAEYVYDGSGEIVCFIAGGAVGKAVKLVQKGASALRKFVTETGAEIGAGEACGALWEKFVKEEARNHEANKKDDHDDHDDHDTGDANSEPDDDSDDDAEDASDPDNDEAAKDGDAEDDDDGDEADSDGDSEEPGAQPNDPLPDYDADGDGGISDSERQKAQNDWKNGNLDGDDYERINNLWLCSIGIPVPGVC